MELLYISAGKFTMGSPTGEACHSADENQVQVEITQGYYFGKYEVTQGEWMAVMDTEPWKGKPYVKEGANYPATYISREDAEAFCKKLKAKEGKEYRLPTEAEWEYACREGTSTAYSFGRNDTMLSVYAWWGGLYGDGNAKSEQYAHLVGQKRPNPWGFYDMHGNVWEWCSDKWEGSSLFDPEGTAPTSYLVYRGGGWDFGAQYCRSANRFRISPDRPGRSVGFRVVLVPSI